MRYHTSGHDNWSNPRQKRATDFGHGRIVSTLDNDSVWSCIRSGLIWTNSLIWGVAAVIAIILIGN